MHAVTRARQGATAADADRRHGVLHLIHGHGGGTEHHVRALIGASRARWRHHLAVAVDDVWEIEAHRDDGSVAAANLVRRPDESWPDFGGGICARFGIDLVHLHNITGCRDGIFAALAALPVPYGYTVHDLGFACPTLLFLGTDGSYCFEQTDPAICGACLRAQPPFSGVDIVDWRARHGGLVDRAAFVIAPSRWAASALARYFPRRPVEVIPHGPPGAEARAAAADAARGAPRGPAQTLALPDDGVPTVAVLGAVGPDKGARRLERLVALVRSSGVALRFALIGYMDVQHGPWQSDDAVLTVHGRYEPRDLPALFDRYRVRLVAFPSAGPETFSFTLSEAWMAGLPAVVPPFGALAERVGDTGAGWLWTEAEWRDDAAMLARIAALVAAPNAGVLAAVSQRARAAPQPTLAAMAERTLRVYDAAVAGFASPPSVVPPTRLGRTFARFAPGRLRAAVRSRLRR